MTDSNHVPFFKRDKLAPSDVFEGDRVTMRINPHSRDVCPSEVTGTVTDAPRESTRELMRDGTRVMSDFRVECEEAGRSYKWEMDNGYVISHHSGLDRSTDVGRFSGFYEPVE